MAVETGGGAVGVAVGGEAGGDGSLAGQGFIGLESSSVKGGAVLVPGSVGVVGSPDGGFSSLAPSSGYSHTQEFPR